MKHFINTSLLAPNVLTVPVDFAVVSEFAELALRDDPGPDYYVWAPWKGFNDMRWVSGATRPAFERFENAFHRLGVAEQVRSYVDLDREVRYFTGMLHTRQRSTEVNFHVDWKANNEGFTLITPIFGSTEQLRLVYRTMKGDIAEYAYRPGEAIIFGDYFTHSSPVSEADTPASLLVLNFGSDKMAHWSSLMHSQRWQTPIIQRPDGKFVRIDPSHGLGETEAALARAELSPGIRPGEFL